jgi:hypothetical protein
MLVFMANLSILIEDEWVVNSLIGDGWKYIMVKLVFCRQYVEIRKNILSE